MERRINPYAPDIIHNFIIDAKKDGAIDRFRGPISEVVDKSTNDPIARRLNTIGLLIGTHLSHTDIADIQGITRSAVNQMTRRTIPAIWKKCSIEIKIKYPPVSLEIINSKKISPVLAKLPTSKRVLAMLNENVPVDVITTQIGISTRQVNNIEIASRKLKVLTQKDRRGLIESVNHSVVKTIQESEDNILIQQALDILTEYQATKLTKQENSPLKGFTTTFAHTPQGKSEQIYDFLKEQHVPVLRIQNFHPSTKYRQVSYFLVDRYATKALECLENSPFKADIQSKVKQISGPDTAKIPTTADLQRSGNFKTVMSLNPLVRKTNLKKISRVEIYKDCPAPIYVYNRKVKRNMKKGESNQRIDFYYHTDDEQEVKEYLDKRLQELGIKPRKSR